MTDPKSPFKSRLFHRPEKLLVDEAASRIEMPPPPPIAMRAPPVPTDPPSPPEEPPPAQGPARIFVGVPGTAPAPRIAEEPDPEADTQLDLTPTPAPRRRRKKHLPPPSPESVEPPTPVVAARPARVAKPPLPPPMPPPPPPEPEEEETPAVERAFWQGIEDHEIERPKLVPVVRARAAEPPKPPARSLLKAPTPPPVNTVTPARAIPLAPARPRRAERPPEPDPPPPPPPPPEPEPAHQPRRLPQRERVAAPPASPPRVGNLRPVRRADRGVWFALIVGLALIACAVWWFILRLPSVPPGTVPATEPAPPVAEVSPSVVAAPVTSQPPAPVVPPTPVPVKKGAGGPEVLDSMAPPDGRVVTPTPTPVATPPARATPTYDSGVLRIETDKRALVIIDGRQRGYADESAPLVLTLEQGEHVVKAIAAGTGASRIQMARVDADRAAAVKFRFRR